MRIIAIGVITLPGLGTCLGQTRAMEVLVEVQLTDLYLGAIPFRLEISLEGRLSS
jgi:hypothetical protein